MVIDLLILLCILAALVSFLCFIHWIGHKQGYKQGQKDSLRAKQKYKLVEFYNGEREWQTDKDISDLKDEWKKDLKIIKPIT